MIEIIGNNKYLARHQKRFKITYDFLRDHVFDSARILDLGPKNSFAEMLKAEGFAVENTEVDLDLNFDVVRGDYDVVTAFQIVEHLVSPFPILRAIRAKILLISVPLSLWFARAYWNDDDVYDCHYHEFEPRQLKMLLNKAGWEIKSEKKWATYGKLNGIRPILRRFTPRHYIVYCERIEGYSE